VLELRDSGYEILGRATVDLKHISTLLRSASSADNSWSEGDLSVGSRNVRAPPRCNGDVHSDCRERAESQRGATITFLMHVCIVIAVKRA